MCHRQLESVLTQAVIHFYMDLHLNPLKRRRATKNIEIFRLAHVVPGGVVTGDERMTGDQHHSGSCADYNLKDLKALEYSAYTLLTEL
jgi:hypothetical protein